MRKSYCFKGSPWCLLA